MLTDRQVRLVRDIALSSVLSRDQILGLRYFTSVTRLNDGLRKLIRSGYIRRLNVPFHGQGLYVARRRAAEIVGERVASIIRSRTGTPQFIQHCLSVTNTRLMLIANGGENWRFEPQLRMKFEYAGRTYTIKPDGLSFTPAGLVVVEADLGHASMRSLKRKFESYEAFLHSGACREHWESEWFSLLCVTTGRLRASRITRLVNEDVPFDLVCRSHDDLGIAYPGSWS